MRDAPMPANLSKSRPAARLSSLPPGTHQPSLLPSHSLKNTLSLAWFNRSFIHSFIYSHRHSLSLTLCLTILQTTLVTPQHAASKTNDPTHTSRAPCLCLTPIPRPHSIISLRRTLLRRKHLRNCQGPFASPRVTSLYRQTCPTPAPSPATCPGANHHTGSASRLTSPPAPLLASAATHASLASLASAPAQPQRIHVSGQNSEGRPRRYHAHFPYCL